MSPIRCRSCQAELTETFVDLGQQPLSNAYLTDPQLRDMEPFYPLQAYVCSECLLVQVPEYASPETIFSEYAYFSSCSDSWLEHCRRYAAAAIDRFALGDGSRVVEVASNDGYLLQYFRDAGVEVLGIEPAANVARAALDKGIDTRVAFFGEATARELLADRPADLLIGNNVLAHVPDLNDFIAGLRVALGEGGTITMEFPHLLNLMEHNQFDTIYHEHFSYFSLYAVERAFERHDLRLFDVDRLATHGGSLRIYACHAEDPRAARQALHALRDEERDRGLDRLETYRGYQARLDALKCDLLSFLIDARRQGKRVVGYGAPAKGNTLLNYCGVRRDLLEFTVDRNPYKQGRYLPGTHVPVHSPERIDDARPDYVLILPWNLTDEIVGQMDHVRRWGGRFVVAVPHLEVVA